MLKSAVICSVIICHILLLSFLRVDAAVIHVKTTGSDSNNGFSWELAKKTVQAGLNAAVAGDEVWVAAGTYVQRITLKSGVALYGGFGGAETNVWERNYRTNHTILDGNRGGSVVKSPPGATSATRIDGFIIRNGKAGLSGGAIYCFPSSPTICNNTMTGNTGTNGGAISCQASSTPFISNNIITGNTADNYGGGIGSFSASPVICNNVISGNGALRGAGIASSSSSPTIVNNTLAGNDAPFGGGLFCESSSASISNNIIAFNSSGILSSGGSAILRNNDVYGNAKYNYSGVSKGVGDMSADPLFGSAEYGNYHIRSTSPCVDAGSNPVVTPSGTDIDGEPRIQNGAIDIGADESDRSDPSAGPYVVIRVAPDGDDRNDGSSWSLAKQTIESAVNTASAAGGEVWVKAGEYTEAVELRPYAYLYGGFAGRETNVSERESASKSIIGGAGENPIVAAVAGYRCSKLDGFTVRNGLGEGISCISASPLISNNAITNNSYGGIRFTSSSPVISRNTISMNRNVGVGCGLGAPIIYDNIISGNCGVGIRCANNCEPVIANNTITGNITSGDGNGIYCESAAGSISNNIVAFNSSGIYRTTKGSVFRNNDVYGNLRYDYAGGSDPTGTAGNISVDPKLAGWTYGNVHIQPNSPCVDAGDGGEIGAGRLDINGQPRVQGLRIDIGADESDGTPWPDGPSTIVHVSPSGVDSNDGSSWQLAKRSVQAAIDAASSIGGEVWVAAGEYHEHITMTTYVHIFGGFAGTERTRTDRHPRLNNTILDGESNDSTVAFPYVAVGTIDGFTIRKGDCGIYIVSSAPKVSNNVITGARGSGGLNCRSSSAVISDNIISGNIAGTGGGITCYYGSCIVTNNTISGNVASGGGGGIYCLGDSAFISSNVIASNGANNGGGICCSGSSAVISNNTVVSNTALGGGGIRSSLGAPIVSNNIVAFNSSGIVRSYDSLSLRNNDVFGNLAYDYLGLQPGIGDISADPLFADMAAGDYHLLPDSPCINAGWNDAPGLPLTDIDGQGRICWGAVDIGADELWPVQVKIDILPGVFPNRINLKSKGLTPVAILTTSAFDAAAVDPETVELAGCPAARRAKDGKVLAEMADVDHDGDSDLVVRFQTDQLRLQHGASATLSGRTVDGRTIIEGTDSVVIVGS